MYKNKGITIVSLVITIILLIILSGISIQALTNTGLFEAAGRAKKEAKRAQVEEWLNLKLIEEQAYNPLGTPEEIINATKSRVENNKEELEKIGNTVTVEEIKTEEDGEQVDIYFYVQVDKDVFKVELKGTQFIGEAGKFPPIITLDSIKPTTNSIEVKVSTKRNENGKIEFYIKKEEEKYELRYTATEEEAKGLTYTFSDLEQNKKYSIKIVAVAENKLTAEVSAEKELGKVEDLTDSDIDFTYTPSGWTNGSVKVTAALSNNKTSSYTLRITDTDPTTANKQTILGWKTGSEGITVNTNKTVYAVLVDNEGQIGTAATGNVQKIDTQKPVANVSSTTTTNSVTFTGTDTAKTGESASGIAAYIVQESNTAPAADSTSWQSYNGTSKTVSGLTQGKTYNVFVKDNAGNVSEAASKGTGTVTNLQQSDINFTYDPNDWTNGSVKVTAALKEGIKSSYTLKITDSNPVGASKQTALGWTNASTGITVSTNKTVYAVLIDNEGQIGTAATGNVQKIDTQKPVANVSSTTTTNSVTFTGTDTAKTGESASGIAAYIVKDTSSVPDKTDSAWQSYNGTSKTVSGLTQGKTYYVFVKDNAGNVSEAASKGTGTVTNLQQSDINFTYDPNDWTNGSVKVTAALKEGIKSSYTLKITDSNPVGASKQTALGWTNASTGITVSTNKTIYAVLIDNEGQIGTAATGNVQKIDTQKPVANVSSTTTNSVTFTGTDTAKTGESASGIAAYIVQESNTAPAADSTSWQSYNGTSKTVSGLTQGKTYYVFVKDKAGNVSAAASKGTGTVTNLQQSDINFTYDPNDWTNGSVKVTAALKEGITSSYTLKITDSNPVGTNKSTALGWTNASTGITVSTNKTIYAVLVDNEGQIGAAATGNVQKIDTQKPVANVSSTTTNSVTFTGTDTEKTGESASGIAGYIVQESSTAPAADSTSWQSYNGTSKTVSGLTQGKTYNVFVKDNAGNVSAAASKGTGTVTNLTSANIDFTYNPNTWTNGSVKVTATLKDMTSSYTLKITDSNPVGASKQTALGWTNASTGITVSTNKTIYAVLIDNEGQIGAAASGNVDKIDTVAPTISTALSSTAKGIDSVTLSVGITDTKSGLGKIEWYYGTTNNPTILAGTTKVTDLNGSTAGPTTAQTKTATVTGLSAGTTYFFKVIAYDVAGKTATSSVISVTTDNPTAADITYTPKDTSWKVDNVKSALDYLYSR